MARKRRIFGYQELMNALDGALSRDLIIGVLVLAADSWKEKALTDYSMTAVLTRAIERIKALGGNLYEVR